MKKEAKGKKALQIYLFRHGRTFDNIEGKFSGWRDSKLAKSGKDDAKIIALRLKKKKFNIAFQTKLSRSKDTLKEVLKFHKNIKIIEDNRIIERNYGKLNGMSHLDIVKKYGPEKYDSWHRTFHGRPPKGESFSDIEKRVRSFIKFLIPFMKKNKVSVAISAHGNSIRLFRKIMERKSEKEAVTWEIPYDKVFSYSV
jgi:2,3-bisphosphoglycerate-dependent phosphoglycerate mutase